MRAAARAGRRARPAFAIVALAALAFVGCQRRGAPPEGAEVAEGRGAAGAAREVATGAPKVAPGPAAPPGSGPAAPGEAGGLAYVERQSGGAADEALPMVVAIHGLGDTPEHLGDALVSELGRPVRVILPRGPKAYGRGFAWFELGSNEAMLAGIERATEFVAAGLGEIARKRPTRGKPIVLGFSQGGMITFALAARHPGLASAAFPVAGFLPSQLTPPPGVAPTLPRLVAFHGADDPIVQAAWARDSIARLRAAGAKAELHVYDGLGHSISPALRAELRREVERALDAIPR